METRDILQSIIAAHGGLSLWNRTNAVEGELSARGFLFVTKHVAPLVHVRITAKAHEPRFSFHDYPSPGLNGELIGCNEVRITDSSGNIVKRRIQPRSAFTGLRRMFYWDALDFVYFAGYATWNYLVSPFLFLMDDIDVKPIGLLSGMPHTWVGLEITFPENIPVHCKTQQFYFDENRLLRRFDYTAEVVGNWARAAQRCGHYRNFDGLLVPVKRQVLPLFRRVHPLPGPALVDIDIHDLRPIPF